MVSVRSEVNAVPKRDIMKKKLSCLIIVLVTFFFLSETCKAELDSTIRYLMNEPVSMLELGLFRLEIKLKQIHSPLYSVIYFPDSNRIYIEFYIGLNIGFDKEIQDIQTAKDRCKRTLKSIRKVANSLTFYKSFTHLIFSKTKHEPEKLAENLMSITDIKIFATYGKEKMLSCRASLLGKDIYFFE
jgi:hypothetical protein